MNVIYKYAVDRDENGAFVTLPVNSHILSSGYQGNDLFVWARVSKGDPNTHRKNIEVFGTGQDMPELNASDKMTSVSRRFLNTVFQCPYVWHVYVIDYCDHLNNEVF